MSNATEAAIRTMIVFPADNVEDQPGIAYGDVEYKGERYSIQYSRPRHPSTIGRLMDSGVAVYVDDGHDGNAFFYEVLGDDVDFADVVHHITIKSGAEAAIERSE